ncbi:MAG: hypothetical protein J2O38_01435, partial [Acidimicrobiales bacterium]|nr:hypothetical protein [Acidimicrobiales bacterium]
MPEGTPTGTPAGTPSDTSSSRPERDNPLPALHPSVSSSARRASPPGGPVVIVSQLLGWQAAALRSALGPAWQVRRAAIDSSHLLVVGRADAIVIGPSPPGELSRLRRRYPHASIVVVSPHAASPAIVSTWLAAGADTCLLDPDLPTLAAHLLALLAGRAGEPAPIPYPKLEDHLSGPGSVGPPSPNGAGAGPVGTGPGSAGRPAIAG